MTYYIQGWLLVATDERTEVCVAGVLMIIAQINLALQDLFSTSVETPGLKTAVPAEPLNLP